VAKKEKSKNSKKSRETKLIKLNNKQYLKELQKIQIELIK